jgi:hypothetical protein
MAVSRLVSAEDHVVILDYGQFYLLSYVDPDTGDELPEVSEVVDQAIASDGIAQIPGLLVVLSPHQANFKTPLRIEVWDGPPPGDAAEWPEAFEAHLDVAHDGLSYHSPAISAVRLGVRPGAYHALITGRGFVAHGWPGSTTPGDSWRIRLWPSPGPLAPRRLRAWHSM